MIKEIIRKKRLEKGWTMKELADKVGVSEATISRWESGEISNMKHKGIVLLAETLGISPATLMGWEDEVNEEQDNYYLNDEVGILAEELRTRPELKVLFDASRKVSKEDLKLVVDMLERMKKE